MYLIETINRTLLTCYMEADTTDAKSGMPRTSNKWLVKHYWYDKVDNRLHLRAFSTVSLCQTINKLRNCYHCCYNYVYYYVQIVKIKYSIQNASKKAVKRQEYCSCCCCCRWHLHCSVVDLLFTARPTTQANDNNNNWLSLVVGARGACWPAS